MFVALCYTALCIGLSVWAFVLFVFDNYSQNTSLTNSWLISVCFPGDLIPGLHNVPQRLVINAHNQNHLRYPVLNNHVRLQFDFVRWKHNSASLHCS